MARSYETLLAQECFVVPRIGGARTTSLDIEAAPEMGILPGAGTEIRVLWMAPEGR